MGALVILYSYLSFCIHIIIFVSAHNTLFFQTNYFIVTIVSNFQGIIIQLYRIFISNLKQMINLQCKSSSHMQSNVQIKLKIFLLIEYA